MKFNRTPVKKLPNGKIAVTYPFHISLEGLETRILCREDEDYDVFVKYILLCAIRRNVIIVTYIVVSNHAHAVVLAESKDNADSFSHEVKRVYSMYFCRKYSDNFVMKYVDADSRPIDSDWYLRNAIAYDLSNSLDNGVAVSEYKWSGYRAYFCGGTCREAQKKVSDLKQREMKKLLHSDYVCKTLPWILNGDGEIEPASACDWQYLEEAFDNDQKNLFKCLGLVDNKEMRYQLIEMPRKMLRDEEFLRFVNDISLRWFQRDVHNIPMEKKFRVARFAIRKVRTSPAQIARAFEIERNVAELIMKK